MNSRILLLVVALGAIAAGIWLILATLPQMERAASVIVHNYDPPGLPYSLVVLKAGPGREYDRIGFLGPGLSAKAIARDDAGGWLRLDEPAGWVSLDAAEVTGDVDALPVSGKILDVPVAPAVTVSVPAGGVAVVTRFGPDEAFDALGTLEPAESSEAIARDSSGTWLMLEAGGWIATGNTNVVGSVVRLQVLYIEH